jgi:hypothetical protein
MSLKTYRVRWKDGTQQLLVGTGLTEAFINSEVSISRLSSDAEKYFPVVFVAVQEAPNKNFVKELPYLLGESVEITGKILAVRVGDSQVLIHSSNDIGINLRVNGIEKMFMNGDCVVRRYKVFDLLEDADLWLAKPSDFIPTCVR